jgi:hypothetical protein
MTDQSEGVGDFDSAKDELSPALEPMGIKSVSYPIIANHELQNPNRASIIAPDGATIKPEIRM